jgi:hypothetical protein
MAKGAKAHASSQTTSYVVRQAARDLFAMSARRASAHTWLHEIYGNRRSSFVTEWYLLSGNADATSGNFW